MCADKTSYAGIILNAITFPTMGGMEGLILNKMYIYYLGYCLFRAALKLNFENSQCQKLIMVDRKCFLELK